MSDYKDILEDLIKAQYCDKPQCDKCLESLRSHLAAIREALTKADASSDNNQSKLPLLKDDTTTIADAITEGSSFSPRSTECSCGNNQYRSVESSTIASLERKFAKEDANSQHDIERLMELNVHLVNENEKLERRIEALRKTLGMHHSPYAKAALKADDEAAG